MALDRKGKIYSVVCPSCERERFVAYPQIWNIRKGNSSGVCHECRNKNNKNRPSFPKGNKPWNLGICGKDSHSYGRKRKGLSGDKNPAWKGGVTKESTKIRNSNEYAIWRLSVFERDKFTCVFCSVRGGKLHADHILPFAFFKESRLDINNGRTLCVECHKKTDTYLHKAMKHVTKTSI